jgi:hypothetical protein
MKREVLLEITEKMKKDGSRRMICCPSDFSRIAKATGYSTYEWSSNAAIPFNLCLFIKDDTLARGVMYKNQKTYLKHLWQ